MAWLIAVSVLVAGCSQAVDGDAEGAQPSLTVPSTSTGGAPTTTTPTSAKPTQPPAPGASIGDVIAWIEAGDKADPADYHVATREGATTQLGEDVAFTTPSGKTTCMTDAQFNDGALACLVDLADPPPRPQDAYGEWKGGWVDFDGTTLQVGSARADPGPFVYGNGPELANGDTLSIGDYRCRADQAGLFCVNYAHQAAVRFSGAGIEPFGCLKSVPAPDGVGEAFGC